MAHRDEYGCPGVWRLLARAGRFQRLASSEGPPFPASSIAVTGLRAPREANQRGEPALTAGERSTGGMVPPGAVVGAARPCAGSVLRRRRSRCRRSGAARLRQPCLCRGCTDDGSTPPSCSRRHTRRPDCRPRGGGLSPNSRAGSAVSASFQEAGAGHAGRPGFRRLDAVPQQVVAADPVRTTSAPLAFRRGWSLCDVSISHGGLREVPGDRSPSRRRALVPLVSGPLEAPRPRDL